MNTFSKSSQSDLEDEVLIQQVLDGKKGALSQLLKNHQAFIYNVAWKMTSNTADAKDLSQEVIIKIISNLSKFKFKSTFRTWAYRIVFNHFINDQKKAKNVFTTNFEDLGMRLNETPDDEMAFWEVEEKKELTKEVRIQWLSGMLLCLTKQQRLIYIIGEIFGADHTIGSEIMEISKANFRMKLSKARKDLCHFMTHQCGLVDKENPCKCNKKVKAAIDYKITDAKYLLHNKKEYTTFQSYLADDADYLMGEVNIKVAELHQHLFFKKDFDKKTFIEAILDDVNWKSRLNLY